MKIKSILRHRYSLTRCGKTKIYNAYIISANGEHPKFISGLNGETKIPLSSIIEVSTDIYKYVKPRYGKCTKPDAFIADTKIIHTDFETKNNWHERWEINVCNSSIFLKMIMANNNNKISYTIEPDSLYNTKSK